MLVDRQKEAYKQFKKGHVLVDSYRRGGKTKLLQYIVEQNLDKKIGIFTTNYTMFRTNFGNYKNCSYRDFTAPILLGDEYVLSKTHGKKIACVVTGLPKTMKWKISKSSGIVKLARKTMPKSAFRSQFGLYI